jgi:hypothetical protein
VVLCNHHADECFGDWLRLLNARHPELANQLGREHGEHDPRYQAPQAWKTKLDEFSYPTHFIADQTSQWITKHVAERPDQPGRSLRKTRGGSLVSSAARVLQTDEVCRILITSLPTSSCDHRGFPWRVITELVASKPPIFYQHPRRVVVAVAAVAVTHGCDHMGGLA